MHISPETREEEMAPPNAECQQKLRMDIWRGIAANTADQRDGPGPLPKHTNANINKRANGSCAVEEVALNTRPQDSSRVSESRAHIISH